MVDVFPFVLTTKLAGPVMPLTEAFFILPFESREAVREVVKF